MPNATGIPQQLPRPLCGMGAWHGAGYRCRPRPLQPRRPSSRSRRASRSGRRAAWSPAHAAQGRDGHADGRLRPRSSASRLAGRALSHHPRREWRHARSLQRAAPWGAFPSCAAISSWRRRWPTPGAARCLPGPDRALRAPGGFRARPRAAAARSFPIARRPLLGTRTYISWATTSSWACRSRPVTTHSMPMPDNGAGEISCHGWQRVPARRALLAFGATPLRPPVRGGAGILFKGSDTGGCGHAVGAATRSRRAGAWLPART
jgi:hypothetical protein